MGGLYEVLQKIKPRPGMYIGKASVSDLFHFLVGYEFARGELDIESTAWEDDFHENFQPWVQKKYHVSTSNSWAKIIMLHCGTEQEGFNSFYLLLDEFQNRDKSLEHKPKISVSYEVTNKG
ncbi:MAG: hypothetical protein V7K32_19740 [Nostoc sp.]|uniref:hypothetical protein n=1 Tax=Nostoc sp. TaxID=1180 RepID=UPI002FFBFF25